MTTTRKTAAKAAGRPARSVTPAAPAVARLDILDDFGTGGGQPPQPITLLGVDCDVRREFTGAEVVAFHQLAMASQVEELLALITSDGPGLWAKISPMAPDIAAQILNKLVTLSGLAEGKLFAPLPWPALPNQPAGALPTPESSTTTA